MSNLTYLLKKGRTGKTLEGLVVLQNVAMLQQCYSNALAKV
jgi:hypothetical protein